MGRLFINNLSYLDKQDDAQRRLKAGQKQHVCKECHKWRWKLERCAKCRPDFEEQPDEY